MLLPDHPGMRQLQRAEGIPASDHRHAAKWHLAFSYMNLFGHMDRLHYPRSRSHVPHRPALAHRARHSRHQLRLARVGLPAKAMMCAPKPRAARGPPRRGALGPLNRCRSPFPDLRLTPAHARPAAGDDEAREEGCLERPFAKSTAGGAGQPASQGRGPARSRGSADAHRPRAGRHAGGNLRQAVPADADTRHDFGLRAPRAGISREASGRCTC